MLSQEYLKEILRYDKDSGIFYRNKPAGNNAFKKDSVAGCLKKTGYFHISIGGKSYQAHRLAWLYVHGKFPENLIDHIDGNPSNNSLENLREATQAQNSQNRNKVLSKTGLLGVYFDPKRNKYIAMIGINGKVKNLGRYADKHDASRAYLSAKKQFHSFAINSNHE